MKLIEAMRQAATDEYDFYGIRADDIQYTPGDTVHNSHELYQDPMWDYDNNLIYPEGEGPYAGYYDAGELDGTCCIAFDPTDDGSIAKAADLISRYMYGGRHLHIIGGWVASKGNDTGEIIIRNAKVISSI